MVVFETQLIIAWLVWNKGYSDEAKYLAMLNNNRNKLIGIIDERLHSLMDVSFSVSDLRCEIDVHISNPKLHLANENPKS